MNKNPLSIYVHIPFCMKKCNYCDFLSFSADEVVKDSYVEALCREIELANLYGKKYEVRTVFFGGGTPSLLKEEHIVKILCKLKEVFVIQEAAEITIEANPGTLTLKKLQAYRRCGINRLSIGLQSAFDDQLALLGRVHTREQFHESFLLARRAGFTNINIDVMFGLPAQTLASYEKTLQAVLSYDPEHISAYGLIIEEGTYFARQNVCVPDEDTEREMYELTGKILEENGYERYEISNYAKKGYTCKHNITYWERGEYLGFGLGAASLMNEMRFSNIRELKAYVAYLIEKEKPIDNFEMEKNVNAKDVNKNYINQNYIDQNNINQNNINQNNINQNYIDKNDILTNIEHLTKSAQMEEMMFLGLRMMRGVSLRRFEDIFCVSMYEIYGTVIDKFLQQGLLKIVKADQAADCYLTLTKRGIDISNYVMAEFML